jgi:hypothetical protein
MSGLMMTELKISNTEEEWTIVNYIPLISTSNGREHTLNMVNLKLIDGQKSPSLQSLMIGTTMVS